MPPEPLAERVVAALITAEQTLATAESLTGGLIGAALTAVPGASKAYLGGLITYASELKASLAGVEAEVLGVHGAVSSQAAEEMAVGARRLTGADWAIAVTGVAGPDPQDGHLPGEVWLGLAGPDGGCAASRIDLVGSRDQIRAGTVTAALAGLLARLEAASTNG
ncbi:CinA family protein [Propionicimonas sp.]|uniref:CinA family protein n=1 Tax=Propionicimonas sp. TaxID=1955623 RepID=UPI0017A01A9D|nr:CinA family protein [Propionicimonas sp.]MBU3977226.1 CinA family protein [Actinomycetota bacterium]MBA3021152.1 CinA family protein [Propionicimonas sp.]MBU3985736.1 CinA family protein [Actinomycetota bacterium]MBU4008521.1 CinA family protein [Actinomycetota bacterium]MBU4066329.1 CinA family protein [Actinomycetota bacterium]